MPRRPSIGTPTLGLRARAGRFRPPRPGALRSADRSGSLGLVALLVRGDLRLRLRLASLHPDLPRLQRLGHHALQAELQQAVLQRRTLDHDMVGQNEAALEGAAGDAAIEEAAAFLGLRGA